MDLDKIDVKNLPQDPGQLREMVVGLLGEVDAKERKLRRLQHTLEKLLRWRYGPKRERVDPDQLFLFAVGLVETNQDLKLAEDQKPARKPKKQKGHGRGRLPSPPRRAETTPHEMT